MPSVITHYLLAKRVLKHVSVSDEGAFLLGAQGPDLFFFFRAYPWLPGKSGFAAGNALHEMSPVKLFNTMRQQAASVDADIRPMIDSYMYGFLCHYAVDRTVHPMILARQEDLKPLRPTLAKTTDPYHFYYESALDTLFLKRETQQSVKAFSLTQVIPKPSRARDEALATFYEKVLPVTIGERYPKAKLRHLASDMRQSMFWMTDHVGLKRRLIRAMEVVTRRDATLSSLVRTENLPDYDFLNIGKQPFTSYEYGTCRDTFEELCAKSVSLALSLIEDYANGVDAATFTKRIGFTGAYTENEKEC